MLGGVCRVTISLAVIMFELTNGIQMTVPFMITCLVSKAVGDYWGAGIYDCMIKIRGYPFLHEVDETMFKASASDLMDCHNLEVLTLEPGTIDEVIRFVM